jgi:hypothetical protein
MVELLLGDVGAICGEALSLWLPLENSVPRVLDLLNTCTWGGEWFNGLVSTT